jgi:hypothetical protein
MSDVLKEFKEEIGKGKYDDLIQNVQNNCSAMINSLRLFELSARYETRKLLKMSDQAIRIEKENIKTEFIRLMFSIHISEEIIRKHGINEEYQKMANEVMEIVAERSKQKAKAENAQPEQSSEGDESTSEGEAEIKP